MALLAAVFNVAALNLVLVAACLPIVTIPAALQAAIVVLDRWREEGEDRVVREFIATLRSRPLLRSTLAGGVPIAAAVLAVEEVRHFAHGGAIVNWICLGLGLDALLLSLASLGYALVLGARRPELAPSDVWYMSLSLAARNLLRATPLLVLELGAGGALLVADPSLAVIGVPLGLLGAVRVTAAP